jgi:tocopherol O-methyltransferase
MSELPRFRVDLDHIRKHYDRLPFLYRFLWGEHLHHGYWDVNQSAAEAQVRLMEVLAERAGVVRGSHVLDIGCGVGGSAIWLAKRFDCKVTGLTISPVQARMGCQDGKETRTQ